MKQRISLSRLLHNEKLMMLVSLIAAVVIWALVFYGPANVETITFDQVPIPEVTLSEDIRERYGLYVVSQDKEYAKVEVTGTVAKIGLMKDSDIKLALDASSISSINKAGTYDVRYRIVSYGDYDAVIVGDGIVKVVCDVFYEKEFVAVIDTANVTVSDSRKYRIGVPYIMGEGSEDGTVKNVVKVKGPESDVMKIDRVEASIPERVELSEQPGAFEATLVAYDANNRPINSIQFLNVDENKVTVHVPVETYYKVELKKELEEYFSKKVSNAPAGYGDMKDLLTFTPAELEFWSVSDMYYNKLMDKIKNELVFDFNRMTSEDLTRKIAIMDEENQGNIELINAEDYIEITLNLGEVATETRKIKLTEKNFEVMNLPKGYVCKPGSDRPLSLTLCGPKELLNKIKDEDITLVADLSGKPEGSQSVEFKVETGNSKIWVCYGVEENSKDTLFVQVNIEKETVLPKAEQEDKTEKNTP